MFPKFYENSKVPRWVGRLSPIDPYAFSFGVWVWCRGVLSPRLRRHETIHYKQQLELLFIGQWALYLAFHLIQVIRLRNGVAAYRNNPFELEAYKNDSDAEYLQTRRLFAWTSYLKEAFKKDGHDEF